MVRLAFCNHQPCVGVRDELNISVPDICIGPWHILNGFLICFNLN